MAELTREQLQRIAAAQKLARSNYINTRREMRTLKELNAQGRNADALERAVQRLEHRAVPRRPDER